MQSSDIFNSAFEANTSDSDWEEISVELDGDEFGTNGGSATSDGLAQRMRS